MTVEKWSRGNNNNRTNVQYVVEYIICIYRVFSRVPSTIHGKNVQGHSVHNNIIIIMIGWKIDILYVKRDGRGGCGLQATTAATTADKWLHTHTHDILGYTTRMSPAGVLLLSRFLFRCFFDKFRSPRR